MSAPDDRLVELPTGGEALPLPPELSFLLRGIKTQAERNAVITAFGQLGRGDPQSYPVQFLTLLKAYAGAVERQPALVKKALESALQDGARLLEVHREKVTQAEAALAKRAKDAQDRADRLEEFVAEIKTAIDQDREDRRKTAAQLLQKMEALERANAQSNAPRRRYGWGRLALAAAVGFVLYPFADRILRLLGL